MSMVRLLAFETLGCGCVAGHYREAGTLRPITYIEEKAQTCVEAAHRRNHAVSARARQRRVPTADGPVPTFWHT